VSTPGWIRKTFVVAGVTNLVGVPFITRGFTNDALFAIDPGAFPPIGMALIMAWGLAYIGVSGFIDRAPWCVAAFLAEKVLYTSRWMWWLGSDRPTFDALLEQDLFTGVYYATYGLIDGGLGVFFAYVVLTRGARIRSASGNA
jgi:hypothetical protein